MLEGEQLKRYVDSLERDIDRRLEQGAVGRNTRIIASNNRVMDNYDRMINTGDAVTKSRLREADATDAVTKAKERELFVEQKLSRARAPKSIERWEKSKAAAIKRRERAEADLDSIQRARVRTEQSAARSSRDYTLSQRVAAEVSEAQLKADIAAREELQKRIATTKDAGDALQLYSAGFSMHRAELEREKAANAYTIHTTVRMRRVFDTASDSVERYSWEHHRLVRMMGDSKTSSTALEAQTRRTGLAYIAMERNVRDATGSLRTHLAEEAKAAGRASFNGARNGLPDPGSWAARNLGALTPLGTVTPTLVLPLGAAFSTVVQGATAAAQAIWLLPAALTAAGTGFGVLKIATVGVGDAFSALMDYNNPDKFAEALRMMSPAAQQFMLSIRQLMPAFREVKNAVQDAFFAGLPQVVNDLAKTYRDSFGNMAVGVAGAFNDMIKGIADALQSPGGQTAMAQVFDGIVKAFQELRPMMPALIQLFTQLSAVGMQVLPSITEDLSNAMINFSNFVNNAAASGDLKKWMEEGWQALKAFGSVLVHAGKMMYEVFGLHGPDGIERFKETMFGLITGLGVVLGTIEKFFNGIVKMFTAISNTQVGQVLGQISEHLGGIETTLALLAGGLMVAKIATSFYKWGKIIKELSGVSKTFFAGFGANAAAGIASGTGTAAAAASQSGAAAGAAFAGAGTAAGKGFGSKLMTAIKGFGWIAVGVAIAEGIKEGLRLAKGPNLPDFVNEGIDKLTNFDLLQVLRDSPYGQLLEVLSGTPLGRFGPGILMPPRPSSVLGGGGDIPEPIWGTDPKAPPNPLAGNPLAGLGQAWGEIPDIPLGGFEVPTPNPGGGPTPNIPYGQYSLDSIPLGKFGASQWNAPDPRSMVSQLTPHQIQQGKTKGYGYVVDPQQVFDKESALQQQRAAVEEARARVLELAADNQATEQAKLKAQNDVVQAERTFIKSQVELLEAQRGTWKKINESIKDQSNMLDGLGAEIDADFGISKGLPGIAENLTKFLVNLSMAPVYGQLVGPRAAGGDLGGAKGLVGAAALSGAFGPQFMQPEMPDMTGADITAPGAQVVIPGATVSIPGMTPSAGTPGAAGAGPSADPGGPLGGPGLYPSPGQGLPMRWNFPLLPGGGYPGDAAILSQVPKGGRYDNITKDLTKGLVDCASGVEDLVNIIDGKPTAGGSLTTFNAASLLPGMGFQRGQGGLGDFRIGYTNSGTPHMEATLPGGTPVNFGSNNSVASGGVAGARGANAPGFTDFWYRPMSGAGAGGTQNYPSPGRGGPMRWTLPPLTPGGGAGVGGPGPVTPGPGLTPDAGNYAPLTPSQLTGTGLTNPMPLTAPGGYAPPGTGPSQIGAVVGPPVGTGSGFGGFSGGILGAAQGAVGAAAMAAGMGADAAGGGGAGSAAAAALAQIGIEELNRAIAFAGQAAGIGVSGLMETFLPTGGSELANNNWFTRLAGAVVGMKPLLPNFANISGASADVQGQHLGNNAQGSPGPGNVNVTQNNYNPTGNSTTSDLDRLAQQAAGASIPAMGGPR